ncbi:MAG: glycine cleavage system aminomethyltransferase GcvT [candidate division Zixibacteria bacterium]|nr:glycine cleavage system aminomethyltransferase GcvT [candidate division Zixibacteria bacterium]
MSEEIVKTAFHDQHIAAGAKMVDFAGYRLPIQYQGITAEHLAVRNNVGLFDLSHMGEFEVSGPRSLDFLQKVTTNDVAVLEVGQIQYNCMTLPSGGIVDDLLIYRLPASYMLVVNGANIEKDFDWLRSNLTADTELIDRSPYTSLLAIQGPKAELVMSLITDHDLANMPYYTWVEAPVAGETMMFSRTGYTGEDGFEIYIAPQYADSVWKAVVEAGSKYDMAHIGLGARDTLRLEMKMALYGNDIDETTTPIEAGLSWIVRLDKDFIGHDVLVRQKEEKPKRRLVCLELEGKAIPRPGYDILDGDEVIGNVTSGTFSPSLQKPIALGYVLRRKAKSGSTVSIAIRNKTAPAVVVKPPFYKNTSHK